MIGRVFGVTLIAVKGSALTFLRRALIGWN